MAEEISQTNPAKPKKSKWYFWACGGCGCLIIILVIVLAALRSFSNFNLGDLFGKQSGTNADEEDRAMTKDELIDYFVVLTTFYSTQDNPVKLARWNKETVTVSIADQPAEGGVAAVDDFITAFNRNSTTTKLQRVDQDGDIQIYFQASTAGSAGLSGPSTGADFTIDHADIKLSQEAAIFTQSLDSVLSHEMMHALGFVGHYYGNVCRLLSSKTCGSHLTVNEERLIKMLYGTDVPAGSGESEIRTYFQNWNPQ